MIDLRRTLVLTLSSNFGLGYAPKAPGTFGTLLGIPVFWLMRGLPLHQAALVTLVITLIACPVCTWAGRYYGVVDDGKIVIDELAGYLVTVLFLPFSWPAAIGAFLFFRLFDISKPFPASWFDRKMKNGVGVVCDDLVAGVYAALLLRIALYLLY